MGRSIGNRGGNGGGGGGNSGGGGAGEMPAGAVSAARMNAAAAGLGSGTGTMYKFRDGSEAFKHDHGGVAANGGMALGYANSTSRRGAEW